MENQISGNIYDAYDLLRYVSSINRSKYHGGIINDFTIPKEFVDTYKENEFDDCIFASRLLYTKLPLTYDFYRKWIPKIRDRNIEYMKCNRGAWVCDLENPIYLAIDKYFYEYINHIVLRFYYNNAKHSYSGHDKQVLLDYTVGLEYVADKVTTEFGIDDITLSELIEGNWILRFSLKTIVEVFNRKDPSSFIHKPGLSDLIGYTKKSIRGLKVAIEGLSTNNSMFIKDIYNNADVILMNECIIVKSEDAITRFIDVGIQKFKNDFQEATGAVFPIIAGYDLYTTDLLRMHGG